MSLKIIFKKAVFLILLTTFSLTLFTQEQPNVIVILADDIGVGDISHYRSMHSNNIIVATPTIDALAKNGLTFTNAHSPAALCAPSRYAIMTGNHCYRSDFPWGVWGAYQQSPIRPNQLTLGKLMKKAGYQTAFLGKWHLGGDYLRKDDTTQIYRGPRNKPEIAVDIRKIVNGGPQSNGFDYSFTFPAGIQASPYAVFENGAMLPLHKNATIDYISQENMTKIGVKLDKLEGLGDSHWNPHNMGPLLVNKAIQFIEENGDSETPFFMYYCSQAVHLPHAAPDSLNGKKIKGTTPSSHLDMVKELDVQLEMMVQTLINKGIYENTLIIFTSDNGGLQIKETLASGHQPSSIYRGGKNKAHEGGNRVPFIAIWPNKIKANSNSAAPILGLDILSTLAALTQQTLEKDEAMDSANLLPIFLDEKGAKIRPFLLKQAGTRKEVMIIENGWKLMIQIDPKDKSYQTRTPIALFDLTDNPREQEERNLINDPKYRAKIDDLFDLYNETRDSKIKTNF